MWISRAEVEGGRLGGDAFEGGWTVGYLEGGGEPVRAVERGVREVGRERRRSVDSGVGFGGLEMG